MKDNQWKILNFVGITIIAGEVSKFIPIVSMRWAQTVNLRRLISMIA